MPNPLDSDLLNYILEQRLQPGDALPPLDKLSVQLGINVGKLREQLEVARALGMVEVRTKTGIKLREFSFLPAVRLSLLFGLGQDKHIFEAYTALRNQIEIAFWKDAVKLLTQDDLAELRDLLESAQRKLSNTRFIQIPHAEHRKFHMKIFSRLENPFVLALLEAYWDAYEAVEMNRYAELSYWQEAWRFHQLIYEHLVEHNFIQALDAFIQHTLLLRHRFEAGWDDDPEDQADPKDAPSQAEMGDSVSSPSPVISRSHPNGRSTHSN
jgi:DNA-binding FadR family transcriptional regulator